METCCMHFFYLKFYLDEPCDQLSVNTKWTWLRTECEITVAQNILNIGVPNWRTKNNGF